MLEPLSKYLHFRLLDTLLAQPNHLPDSLSLLQAIESERFSADCILVTFDVESLYPSIPIQEGLLALRDMLLHCTVHSFSLEEVDFLVSAAELVLCWHFLEFYPDNIRITSCISDTSVNLLDVVLFKGPDFELFGKLSTRCYQKPLNAYQYIPFTSWHPRHQKSVFVLNELKRYLLRESDQVSFLKLRRLFYIRLRARGYPLDFLQACFSQVSWNQRDALMHQVCARGPVQHAGFKRAPLVLKLDFCESTRALNLGGTLNPKLHGFFQRHPLL